MRTYGLATGLAKAGARVEVLAPWAPGAALRPAVHDGVTFQHHLLAANALPLVLRDRLVPSMVAHAAQPFALGPRRWARRFGG